MADSLQEVNANVEILLKYIEENEKNLDREKLRDAINEMNFDIIDILRGRDLDPLILRKKVKLANTISQINTASQEPNEIYVNLQKMNRYLSEMAPHVPALKRKE